MLAAASGPNKARRNSREKPLIQLSSGSLVSPKFLEKYSFLFSISIINSRILKYSSFGFVNEIYENISLKSKP